MALHTGEPESLGGYRIVGRLGSGGMGVVYRATSRSGREVAVKVVHAQYAADPVFRARFRQEIEAVRRVSGAFTAPVLDADPEAARPWMATQYVAAPSLAERIRGYGPLPGPELRRLALGLVEALRDIHRAGVVHRDLKPANVLVAADGPRVIDFGISRAAGSQTLTETGHMIGTPPFMSPEQLTDARSVGPASDVFSLAALLAYAATGRGPFDADSPYLTAYRVMHDEPDLKPLTPALRDVLARCLAKKPADRPGLTGLAEEFATIPAEEFTVAPVTAPAVPPAPTEASAPASRPGAAPGTGTGPATEEDGDHPDRDPADRTETPDALPAPEPPAAPPAPRRRRTRLLVLSGTAAALALALTGYLLLGPRSGGSSADTGTSDRWAAVPKGWQPWTTTVAARAATGVALPPENSGDTGTPSCALGGDGLYCLGAGGLPVAVDTRTGRMLWRVDSSPTSSPYGRFGGQVLGVRDGVVLLRQSPEFSGEEREATSVVALDARTGRRLWHRPLTGTNVRPALDAGLALVPDGATVTARSLRDGGKRWSADLPVDHACDFHPAGTGLYVLCSRWDGDAPGSRLLSLDPADGTPRTLARLDLSLRYLGALDGRLVFVRETPESRSDGGDQSYDRLVLVDAAKGTRKTVPLPAGTAGQPALTGDLLLLAGSNGRVTAFSATTGARVWRTSTSLEQPGAPLGDAAGRTAFLVSGSGRAAALDLRTGEVLWESLARAARSPGSGYPPTLFRRAGALVAATPDGTLFSLDPAHPDRTPGKA
ncbi:PQQ-binding-like beta-propeller repeat protein [Streptomyces sp. NPDC058417]|uniref:protein kinase domain-containing protein n=1 Tax=unclassified Streptomyces TaxID=2593676 RepID=UPI00364DD7FC